MPGQTTPASELERGREAYAAHKWVDAHAAHHHGDVRHDLSPEMSARDLESLVLAAG